MFQPTLTLIAYVQVLAIYEEWREISEKGYCLTLLCLATTFFPSFKLQVNLVWQCFVLLVRPHYM